MQYIETIFIITFFACALALGLGMILDYFLFKLLKKNHASYYKSIGEPMIAMFAPADFTWHNYVQLLKGAVFGYIMVFRGLPKGFPRDVGLRKLAQAIRIVFAIFLILLILFVIVSYFFFKSNP